MFVGISVMGLVQMGYVIIFNILLDIIKLLRFIHTLYLRARNRRRATKPTSPVHSKNNISRAETAEIPLFEYVN